MTGQKPRVAILYGLNEGPRHSKRLRAALTGQGCQIVRDCASADYIIAHSGGCFFVPPDCHGKTVLLCNPPFGTMRNWGRTLAAKIWLDARDCWKHSLHTPWFVKSLHNMWYAVTRGKHNLSMLRPAIKAAGQLPAINARQVIIISNRHDPWRCLAHAALLEQQNYTFIDFQGAHDDLWLHPARYVACLPTKQV